MWNAQAKRIARVQPSAVVLVAIVFHHDHVIRCERKYALRLRAFVQRNHIVATLYLLIVKCGKSPKTRNYWKSIESERSIY